MPIQTDLPIESQNQRFPVTVPMKIYSSVSWAVFFSVGIFAKTDLSSQKWTAPQQIHKRNFDPAALPLTTRTLRLVALGKLTANEPESYAVRGSDVGRADGRTGRRMDGRADGRTDPADGRTGGRMDGRADGRTGGRMDGRTDGWMDRRTDGWTDGPADGRTDGRMGGWTDKIK